MFGLDDRPTRLCDGQSRREWLRIGSLSVLGLGLSDLFRAGAVPNPAMAGPMPSPLGRVLDGVTFGWAKNVIYVCLQGGPPQHETFAPKPEAPAEIRGPFRPIATNVPGIHSCELLPRTARMADRLAVVRSIATDDPNHDVSGDWVLTGYPYGPGGARQIKPTDWPYFGSIVKMLRPSETMPALSTVWIPDLMRLNDSVTPAGQTAGSLGRAWEPERFVGDPAAPDYHIEGLELPPELPRLRVDRRRALLGQLDGHLRAVDRGGVLDGWDRHAQHAYDLVSSGRARAAFDLDQEPGTIRDRYGRDSWGQTVLLARRLIEAGVRLIHLNWARERRSRSQGNPGAGDSFRERRRVHLHRDRERQRELSGAVRREIPSPILLPPYPVPLRGRLEESSRGPGAGFRGLPADLWGGPLLHPPAVSRLDGRERKLLDRPGPRHRGGRPERDRAGDRWLERPGRSSRRAANS